MKQIRQHLAETGRLRQLEAELQELREQLTLERHERKQTEESLRASEERLQLAQSAASIGTFDWDLVSGKVLWSPETERLWGLRRGEFKQTYAHWKKLVHPEDLARAEALARKAIVAPKAPYAFEHRVICPNGKVRWVFAKATTIRDASGKALRIVGLNMDITARKQAEEALRQLNATLEQRVAERTTELRESEEKYRALFESSRDAIAINDLQGRTLDCNVAALRMLGYDSREEFLKKTPADFSPPRQPDGRDSRRAARKHIQEALAKGTAYFEWQHQRRDGTVFPAAVLLSRFQLRGRTVIQAAVRDITDQKAAFAALKENQALLEEVGRMAQVGGWEFDVATGTVHWTSELARIHDLPPGTKISVKTGLRFYQGDSRRKLEAAVRKAIEHAKPYDLELEIVTARRKRKWVRILGHPVLENGRVVKVHGSYQDLTGRKRAEETLRESEERFRAVYEHGPIGIALGDLRGRLIFANPSLHKMLGYDEGELAGRNFRQLTFEEDLPAENLLVRQMLAGKRDHYHIEKRYVRKDGQPIWVTLSTSVLRDSQGKPALGLAMIQDITARKRDEGLLRENEQRLRMALQAASMVTWEWDILAGTISYSANTPDLARGDALEPYSSVKNLIKQVHPDDRPALTQAIQRTARQGVPFNCEYRVKMLDGAYHWISAKGDVVVRRDGKPVRAVGVSQDIAERKQAEEALQNSEERYRTLVEAGSDVVYRMSPDWQEMRYLVGRDFITDTKEPSRTWLQQYIHPDDREQVTAVIRRAIRARRVFELEHRVRRVDGSLGWTFSRAIPIMDAEGKIIEWFGTAKDVTARKAAEEEREQTLAEFNTTLLCMTDGVMVFKPDGSLSLMNPAAERILGCSRKNHGCPLGDWFKQLDVTRENGTPFRPEHSLTARALRGETVEPTALSVRTPDGRQFWILSSAAALRTAAGECIGAVTVFADITERKKAEEALRASEERFRIIAASTPDHLLVQDRNLRYTLVVNPQLGLTKQEMIGKTDHDFLLKAEADKLRRLKQKVLRTGQKLHVEMPATSRTGELVYFEGDYVPKRNLQGAVDGLIGYIRNVTERKQAEQALEQANTELRRLARRLTQIEEAERRRLAYVLHEGLQQLLVSALFQLSDLANQRKGRAVRKEIAEVADILDECVNVTRTVTYDSYPPALQQLGIGAALEWLQRYCQKNLGLSVDLLVDEAVQVEVEELKICLFRAAQELLLNVAKHAGVKNARIRLGGHAGREVWLEVSDAGAGFDPAALRVNKSTGSSFGLFSLRERVAMLGGRLEVDSARGAGTRVRLWLPLLPHKSRAGSVAGQPVMNQVCREQKQT